ncbi:MAG: Rieske 2Fe-2S domain-containing protein [Acidimicrobiaceae bacterium]|nr:Rieske 2Fe-2S domain-containing protein [Acidimicrobiaceae bacterium]
MTADPFTMWHPVASAHDVPYRHVHQAQLLGRELAVWRADDDYVNVWENRCLHRGVRLSIGSNDGTELRCQYHGWRYANRSAGCTYIPAHPADAPARTICNRTFSSVERYGLVWSGESPVGDPPAVHVLEAGTPFGLRNLPVNASVSLTVRHLQSHRFAPCGRLDAEAPSMTVDGVSDYSVALTSRAGDARSTVVFFVQPVDSGRCVIRGVLAGAPPAGEQLAVWRHHATELDQLRVAIEAEATSLPAPEPMVPMLQQVPLHLAEVPEAPAGRQPALRVQVQRKFPAAAGVAAFELAPIEGVLPTFQPGAHIDVHLPNGLVRQYSITNGPGESASYRIGVKLEPDSSGGSSCLHETVREGDVLAISEPRNNFPLRRDSTRTVLVAGGIGITPLLAMAQALDRMSLPFELHCFVQSAEHVAFADVVDGLGGSVVRHLGLSPDETVAEIRRLVASYESFANLYVCGPGPMLEAVRREASAAGWPDEAVHFEYFKNTNEIDDSSTFEVALARSAMTVTVPAGATILEVLRGHGVIMPSSCEQGACGTCVATVLEGEPDHQDVYLNDSEHRAGDRIMTCVSRAASDRLVLDL